MTTQIKRKNIFDTVRAMLGRGLKQSEVTRLDQSIDCSIGKEDACMMLETPRQIGADGIALIKQFEGCARLRHDGLVEAYPDPASGGDPWTIGWGATGTDVAPDTVWTQEECDARLASDLTRYAANVDQVLGNAPTTQAQFDALVSFHYNTGAIARATLTRKHIAGDFEGAAREFHRWNKAAGRTLKGLTRRRRQEAQLYSRP